MRADAPGRRRLGRPQLHRGGGRARSRRISSRETIVVNKSTVPVGSTRLVEQALGRQRRVRRVEPRVPPRGLGGQRLPASRPRGHRQRRPERRHPGRVALHRRARAAHGHRPGLGRDHQVRQQRLPRHQALVRERGRRGVRGRRRRRQRRRARHGLRQAHRPRVPAARPGLGRFLLPEGRAGAAVHRPGGRLRLRSARRRGRGQRRAVRPGRREGRADGRRLGRGPQGRRLGPHASRPTPTTCASRPALQILRRLVAAGANVTAYDPTVTEPLADYPDVEIAADAYAAVDGATCWPCSPSGTSSSGSTSTRSPTRWPTAACVDARNLLDRTGARPPRASSTRASGAADGPRRRHRGSRVPRLAPLRGAARSGRRGRRASTTSSPVRSTTSSTSSTRREFTFVEHDVSHVRVGARRRSTPCCTSPARRRRSTTSRCRSRP